MSEGYPDRIIPNNEIESLENLLRSQGLKYPNYEKWISGTINQVRSGNKIAFGFFTKSKEIVGDGIIRITASGTVELKNFFLQKDCRGRGYGPLLLEYIENYCIERGYTQIHVDMPIKERNIIMFFIGNHYDFQARGDFYGQGNESYLLVKKLQIKYIGNYDWIKISKWVMDRIFGYNFVEKVDDKSFIYYKIINNIKLFATALINDNLDEEIDDNSLKLFINSSRFKGNLICLAPYFNDLAIEYANNKGITLINRNELEKLSGYKLPTSSKDIAGLIVVIKPEYFEQLVNNKDKVFIKGGGTPAGVNKNQIILFYITSPTQAIGGYAIITKITQDPPLEIWKKYSRHSAFADEDYKTYTEGKSIVTAYSFEDINKLDNYISIMKLREILGSFNHQAGQRISTEEWGIIKDNF